MGIYRDIPCIETHTHTHTQICTHTHIHTCTYIYNLTNAMGRPQRPISLRVYPIRKVIYIYTYIHIYVYIYTNTKYIYTHTHIYIHTHTRIYINTHIYIYMYIHTHTHTHTHTCIHTYIWSLSLLSDSLMTEQHVSTPHTLTAYPVYAHKFVEYI